jgi:hypothetical protein
MILVPNSSLYAPGRISHGKSHGVFAMTSDELNTIKANIAHYQAMLKLALDGEKRSAVERLLAEAEDILASDF